MEHSRRSSFQGGAGAAAPARGGRGRQEVPGGAARVAGGGGAPHQAGPSPRRPRGRRVSSPVAGREGGDGSVRPVQSRAARWRPLPSTRWRCDCAADGARQPFYSPGSRRRIEGGAAAALTTCARSHQRPGHCAGARRSLPGPGSSRPPPWLGPLRGRNAPARSSGSAPPLPWLPRGFPGCCSVSAPRCQGQRRVSERRSRPPGKTFPENREMLDWSAADRVEPRRGGGAEDGRPAWPTELS